MYLFLTQFNNIYQLYTLFQTCGQNPEVKSDSDKMFPFAFLCNIIWKKKRNYNLMFLCISLFKTNITVYYSWHMTYITSC